MFDKRSFVTAIQMIQENFYHQILSRKRKQKIKIWAESELNYFKEMFQQNQKFKI